jgi:GT2 family glycosyltransferase
MDISVVIVNWNTRDILRDCLKTIYEQTARVDFEVVVVDNASEDGSVEMVRSEFPQAVLLANQKNVGYAAANNQGMKIAGGRYVLVLNSDTLILDGAIDKMVEFADAHPGAGVLGCRVRNADGTLQPTCFMFPSALNSFLSALYLNKLFPRSRFFGREAMSWWDRNDVREVEVVTGCFMLVRKEALDEIGLMDERFFMYAEETDWCWRFRKAGWQVLFTPTAEIVHLGGQSTAKRSAEMFVQLRVSILKFVLKNQGRLAGAIVRLNTMAFLALRAPIWMVVRLLVPGRKRQASTRIRAYADAIRQIALCRG